MTSIQFVERVYALNLVASVNEVQEVAKQLFPDCVLRQMGYFGGYCDIIENNEVLLRNYLGEIIKDDIDDDYFEGIELGESAFGTIYIELSGFTCQIYHAGIGEWRVEYLDGENQNLGSYQNAIQYLFNLKNSK